MRLRTWGVKERKGGAGGVEGCISQGLEKGAKVELGESRAASPRAWKRAQRWNWGSQGGNPSGTGKGYKCVRGGVEEKETRVGKASCYGRVSDSDVDHG